MNQVLERTSSGGFCGNDTLMHLTLTSLPFGGIGRSKIPSPGHWELGVLHGLSHGEECEFLPAASVESVLDPLMSLRSQVVPSFQLLGQNSRKKILMKTWRTSYRILEILLGEEEIFGLRGHQFLLSQVKST